VDILLVAVEDQVEEL
jgi:hypothetical protein